ncbi:hypothetical protein BpHYR1_030810 [Brachionus plicatilis]|uniref:Uncharacterized protein n=1 Tax=Brachionus plicatilis TaxID=10195 RepID=A0A3M7PAH4_BRAPC|nr:hypothetical protein BpHYR1_030810 [Brachionus plicatilis]
MDKTSQNQELLVENLLDELTNIEMTMEVSASSPERLPKKNKRLKTDSDTSLNINQLDERIERLEKDNKILRESLDKVLQISTTILNLLPSSPPNN